MFKKNNGEIYFSKIAYANDIANLLVTFTYLINLFVDIDECSTNSHSCDVNAVCSNIRGSYTCKCKAGYSGDGITCSGMYIVFLSLSVSVCLVLAVCFVCLIAFFCIVFVFFLFCFLVVVQTNFPVFYIFNLKINLLFAESHKDWSVNILTLYKHLVSTLFPFVYLFIKFSFSGFWITDEDTFVIYRLYF